MNLRRKCNPKKLAFAQEMRKKPTRAEALVWEELRYWRYAQVKFRRQSVLRGYIADFYCAKAKLVVEIDGPIHNAAKDRIRDSHLAKVGIKVIRFTNKEVFTKLPHVLVEIRNAYRRRKNLCKYLIKKRVKKTKPKAKETFYTNPQDSSSSYIDTLREKGSDDCACGYVQISDKVNNCLKLIRLPLFESVLEKDQDDPLCGQQVFSDPETAENFARMETKNKRPSESYRCQVCKHFHVKQKALTRIAVVR